jgi:uncharacterized caspase-like protein
MFGPGFRNAFLLNIAVVAAIVWGAHPVHAENRIALVIGQSSYRAVVPLTNPANDARAMSRLLGDAGFEVQTANDLSQNEMRQQISDLAAKVAEKGPDTTVLVFYAGHGIQIDGENYLVPVDVDPKREADIPLQAVRLNDVLNTLASVPSKMRILLLDACRNNPFPDISKTAGRGLAIVDAKTGDPGTFVSFSTSPGAEAEDGAGADSPYTSALLVSAKEPGLSIEDTFRHVRVSVNKATDGRQTPWDSSSLTEEFSFFPGPNDVVSKQTATKRTVEDWRRALQGRPVEAAHEMIVSDGSDEAYEAFVGLFAQSPFGSQARLWLDRHRRMVAWNNAVLLNTVVEYHAFLALYPDSDLTATAQKLEDRLRHRPVVATVAMNSQASLVPVSTGPCTAPSAPLKKADLSPAKNADPQQPRRSVSKPRRPRDSDDDDVVDYRRPPPVDYDPAPPVGVRLGFGSYGGGGFYRGGGFSRGGYGGGGFGRGRGGY